MGTEKNAPSPTMQCRPNCLGHFFGEKPLEFHMEAIYCQLLSYIYRTFQTRKIFVQTQYLYFVEYQPQFDLGGGRRELPATHLPAKFVLGPEKWSPILVCACRTYLIWQQQLWIIKDNSDTLW